MEKQIEAILVCINSCDVHRGNSSVLLVFVVLLEDINGISSSLVAGLTMKQVLSGASWDLFVP